MKTKFLTACVLAGLGGTASASVVYNFNPGLPDGGQIPDANPAGWSDTRTLSGLPTTGVLDVHVTLSLAGGYNGDLYGYLVHGSAGLCRRRAVAALPAAGEMTGGPPQPRGRGSAPRGDKPPRSRGDLERDAAVAPSPLLHALHPP